MIILAMIIMIVVIIKAIWKHKKYKKNQNIWSKKHLSYLTI